MKCNKCNFTWDEKSMSSNFEMCPVCGSKINESITVDESTSFGSVLKEIEKRCGKEIWKDRAKAVSVFKDLAPGMEKEKILLMLALESQIRDIFEKEKEFAVSKAKIRLLDILGERPIEEILLAFSDLYNIEVDRKMFAIVTVSQDIQNNSYKTFVGSENTNMQSGFSFANLKVGDIFDFGNFEGRKIKWKVLKKDKDSFYVISTEILCNRAFNSNYSNNWSKSKLKRWLNGYFYKCSFSLDEQTKIKSENSENVTLLSKEEAEILMTREERKLNYWWWLRSPLSDCSYSVWIVSSGGDFYGDLAYSSYGVRPALHLYY